MAGSTTGVCSAVISANVVDNNPVPFWTSFCDTWNSSGLICMDKWLTYMIVSDPLATASLLCSRIWHGHRSLHGSWLCCSRRLWMTRISASTRLHWCRNTSGIWWRMKYRLWRRVNVYVASARVIWWLSRWHRSCIRIISTCCSIIRRHKWCCRCRCQTHIVRNHGHRRYSSHIVGINVLMNPMLAINARVYWTSARNC